MKNLLTNVWNAVVKLFTKEDVRSARNVDQVNADKISIFVHRLRAIGIDVELHMNYPWVYLYKVNGRRVKELYRSKYYFTLAYIPIRLNSEITFTDIPTIFKTIRKYK